MAEKQQTGVAEAEPPAREPALPTPAWTPASASRRRTDVAASTVASQIIVAVAVVLTICYFAKLVLVTLLVSILLAYVLDPVVSFLEEIKIVRPVGAALALLLLVGILYATLYFGYSKGVEFVEQLPKYSSEIKRTLVHFRHQAQKLQQSTQQVLPGSEDGKKPLRVDQQTDWSEVVGKYVGTVGEVLLAVSFIPFLVFFMLTWQDHARAATVMLLSMENRNTAYVTLGRISEMVRGC